MSTDCICNVCAAGMEIVRFGVVLTFSYVSSWHSVDCSADMWRKYSLQSCVVQIYYIYLVWFWYLEGSCVYCVGVSVVWGVVQKHEKSWRRTKCEVQLRMTVFAMFFRRMVCVIRRTCIGIHVGLCGLYDKFCIHSFYSSCFVSVFNMKIVLSKVKAVMLKQSRLFAGGVYCCLWFLCVIKPCVNGIDNYSMFTMLLWGW